MIPSFFLALPKGKPLWKPRAGVAIECRSGVFAAVRASLRGTLRAENMFSKTITDGIIKDAVRQVRANVFTGDCYGKRELIGRSGKDECAKRG